LAEASGEDSGFKKAAWKNALDVIFQEINFYDVVNVLSGVGHSAS
jgi:hypothetical protein